MEFKNDFVWGAATAAYQLEGAAYSDGKGASVWDMFCEQPGKIFEGHSGLVACDHYNRYKEDVSIMKEIGINAYRFSVSWPRIIPDGTGKINDKGLKFYSNLIDELLKNNITPYMTLFHWDYPYSLFCRGGWLNPDSHKWFAEYAEVLVKAFGDRVKNYFTLNEPQIYVGLGHQIGVHAPGSIFPARDLLQMGHHTLLSHGYAVQAIRATVKNSKVGYAPAGSFYYPNTNTPKDIEAARKATFSVSAEGWCFSAAWWSDPIFFGKYPEVEALRDIMPKINSDDMAVISQPLDFYGQNFYQAAPVEYSDNAPGFKTVARPVGHAKTAIGWSITPEGIYWLCKFLYERYNLPIIITENGMSSHDAPSPDGKVHDPNRIDYLHSHLENLKKAADDGVDIIGYLQWSFMDNFEWAKGYDDRFGLVYVDYNTQQRIIKDSGYWYRDYIKAAKGS